MSELKDMPCVTVEQVSRFRDEALQQLAARDARIAELEVMLDSVDKDVRDALNSD